MSFLERFRWGGRDTAGSALVIVLMAVLLMSAMGLAMVLLATTDTLAASNQRDARVALYAAEAGIEHAASELMSLPDWDAVLSGAVTSTRADGPPTGARWLPGGGTVVLEQVANLANCGAAAACSAPALEELTGDRPWGRNNPRWRPFLYGLPGAGEPEPGVYVVVLVGDDPSETDDDPERDGRAPGNPGAGIALLRAEAFGPRGARRIVEVAVSRVAPTPGSAAPRVLAWKEVR